jgi:hypothetical protein
VNDAELFKADVAELSRLLMDFGITTGPIVLTQGMAHPPAMTRHQVRLLLTALTVADNALSKSP